MKASFGEKIFLKANALFLALAALSCLIPLLHIVSLSLSDSQSIMSGEVGIWPKGWTLEAYDAFFKGTNAVNAFYNSIIITLIGTALSMTFTTLAAYPLSREYFYGRRFFTLAIVFTMLFGGGLIPTYLVVKSFGLINTYGALWLPGLVSAFNMLIMKTFFENIPKELEEAARIDGCSEWRLILQIMIPLSKPVMATLALFYGVGYWNSFMSVLIYINETDKYNLTVLVQQMIQTQSVLQEALQFRPEDAVQMVPEAIRSAGIIVMIVPMLVVYPFLQKYFVKGVMIGSVKG